MTDFAGQYLATRPHHRASARDRTSDLPLRRRVLYPLSYKSEVPSAGIEPEKPEGCTVTPRGPKPESGIAPEASSRATYPHGELNPGDRAETPAGFRYIMGAEASAAEGDLAKDDGCPDALDPPRRAFAAGYAHPCD